MVRYLKLYISKLFNGNGLLIIILGKPAGWELGPALVEHRMAHTLTRVGSYLGKIIHTQMKLSLP